MNSQSPQGLAPASDMKMKVAIDRTIVPWVPQLVLQNDQQGD